MLEFLQPTASNIHRHLPWSFFATKIQICTNVTSNSSILTLVLTIFFCPFIIFSFLAHQIYTRHFWQQYMFQEDMLHCQIEQLLPCANGLSTNTKLSDLISTLAFFWFILQNAETFLYLIHFGRVNQQISLSLGTQSCIKWGKTK